MGNKYLLPLLLSALYACGDSANGPDGPPSSVSVKIGNNYFQSASNSSTYPAVDTVAVNGSVTWEWIERGTHTVRFDAPGFADGPPMTEVGSLYSVTFPTAGTYNYHCSIHGPVMLGSIVVK